MSKHHSKPPHSPDPVLDRVAAIAAGVCTEHGVDLVSVAWAGSGVLRVTIERILKGEHSQNGGGAQDIEARGWGVNLDDCADVSRALSAKLDSEDPIHTRYNLEVSSPGLDRELTTQAEFARFVGLSAKVKLTKAAPDGQKLLRGTIERVEPEALTMHVDNKSISVPFSDVAQANLVFELQKAKKRTNSKRSRS